MFQHVPETDLGRLAFLHVCLKIPLRTVAARLGRDPAALASLLPLVGLDGSHDVLSSEARAQWEAALASTKHLRTTLQPGESYKAWCKRVRSTLRTFTLNGDLGWSEIDALAEADNTTFGRLLDAVILRAVLPVV